MGTAFQTADAGTRALVESTLQLGEAYKKLGTSSEAGLQYQVTEADKAFKQIAASGKASLGDLAAGYDGVYAAQKKLVDHQNTDVRDAYQQGKITATDYYTTIIARAQDAYDSEVQKLHDGLTTQADVDAKKRILDDERKAYTKATNDEIAASYHALGEKSGQELDAATAQWAKYAAVIAKTVGTDSRQYIEAEIKTAQAMVDKLKLLGQKPPDDLMTYLASLQTQLVNTYTPAERVANALKNMGITSSEQQLATIQNYAQQLAIVKQNADGSAQSIADIQLATDKLDSATKNYVDTLNTKWIDAFTRGDITQTQLQQHMTENAALAAQQFQNLGTTGAGATEQINSGVRVLGDSLEALRREQIDEQVKAWHYLGVQTQTELNGMVTASKTAYEQIASDANASQLQKNEAWLKMEQNYVQQVLQEGGKIPTGVANDMAAVEQSIKNSLDTQTSQWATAYGGVATTIGNTFDGLVSDLVTGKGSFQDTITQMWQGIATAALDGFIAPVKKAITEFISTTIADLLSGKGLSGVLDSLKQIGSAVSGLFSTGTSAASGAAGAAGTAAQGAAGAASTGAGAAGTALSTGLSSAMSIVGAVGAVGSFVTGVIGDIQNAHQTDILKSIEHNTRYSMMYLGEQSDKGIFGLLTAIRQDLEWGLIFKEIARMADEFMPYSANAQAYLKSINDLTLHNIWPTINTMEAVLETFARIPGILPTC